MPLIPPLVETLARRHWQLVAAAVICILFLAFHFTVFEAEIGKRSRVLAQARRMGLAVDAEATRTETPPRVLVLLAANTLPPAVKDVNREAGALASSMLEEITQNTARRGMQVLAAEPGLTSQESRSVEIRAHLRIRSTFPQFVALLDDLGRESSLMSVDRFTLTESEGGRSTLDLWVTRLVLKPEPAR